MITIQQSVRFDNDKHSHLTSLYSSLRQVNLLLLFKTPTASSRFPIPVHTAVSERRKQLPLSLTPKFPVVMLALYPLRFLVLQSYYLILSIMPCIWVSCMSWMKFHGVHNCLLQNLYRLGRY
jgi:hypothetical protein